MSNLNEIARLVRAELSTLIQPVQLLSVNTAKATGEVSGRFRSNGILFDYKIGGGNVSYRPVGSGGQGSAARRDGYEDAMAAMERSDAGGKPRNCSKGFSCGNTCIQKGRICKVKAGAAAAKLSAIVKYSGGGQSQAQPKAEGGKAAPAAAAKRAAGAEKGPGRAPSLQEVKAGVLGAWSAKSVADLKGDKDFQMAMAGSDNPLRTKEDWLKIYREFVGVPKNERNLPDSPTVINGIDVLKNFRPWTVFGLDPKTATNDDIRKAFRKAIIKHHPDQGGDPRVVERLKTMRDSLLALRPEHKKPRGRKDAADPLADARVLALSLQASRRRLDGAVSPARLDGYREVMGYGRMDARKGKKNCSKGYGCGSTCIESTKECIKQGGAASQKLAGVMKGGGSGATAYKGYQLSPPDKLTYEGKNAEVAKVTRALRNWIGEREPATTRTMIDTAEKYGAKLDGLAHRLKTEKSLGRKIENESKGEAFKGNIQAAADSMSDVVRYTLKTTNERYTETAENVIKDFESAGYTARVKNYWEEGQPYRGMNVALTSPEGLKVELQLHTPQSLYVKHKTHPLYEQYRVETNDRKRRQLFDRMLKITNSLVPPWGTASTSGAARSPQVRSIQQQTAVRRQRLMGIGQRKVLGFQTAQEAGLV